MSISTPPNPRLPQKNRRLQSCQLCEVRHGARPRNQLHRQPCGGANRRVSQPRKALKHVRIPIRKRPTNRLFGSESPSPGSSSNPPVNPNPTFSCRADDLWVCSNHCQRDKCHLNLYSFFFFFSEILMGMVVGTKFSWN